MDIKDTLIKARIKLLYEKPFFANLSLYLKLVEKRDLPFPIGVDFKGNLYYNPDIFEKENYSFGEIKAMICHETLHLALQHLLRREKREPFLWNLATDIVVNNILLENGFILPKGSIILRYKNNLFAEEVYDLIKKELDKHKELSKINDLEFIRCYDSVTKQTIKKYRFDKHIEFKGNKKEYKKEADKWKKRLVKALTLGKLKGMDSLGIERLVDKILKPKINWKSLLYRYIVNELPFDYTYNYPSKRSLSLGIYLPKLKKEYLDIIVSIDTSGSISQEELNEFLTEIINIGKSFNNIKITILVCDYKIHNVYELNNGNIDKILKIKLKGYGGTSHKPIFEWIKKNKPFAKLLIAFTDGYTEFPNSEVIKTIWVITKNGISKEELPFGKYIKIE